MSGWRRGIARVGLVLLCAGPMAMRQARAQKAFGEISVEQLNSMVRSGKHESDGELAKELERVKLSERLSSGRLAELSAELPGEKSKEALMIVGDDSVFLAPPADETPRTAIPDIQEQRRIAALAVTYLEKILPRLPNFFATRTTIGFETRRVLSMDEDDKARQEKPLRWAGEEVATVLYRDGREVLRDEKVKSKKGSKSLGLITSGTFGPILNTVVVDAAQSSMRWARWEKGPKEPLAVFEIRVPKEKSHYSVSFPKALPTSGEMAVQSGIAYHGEIGIDPTSGSILRLVLEADPEPVGAIERGDIMVEYGAVDIGGKDYMCPVRSVSLSRGRSGARSVFPLESQTEITRLNDVVFSGYHIFRSDFRIVP